MVCVNGAACCLLLIASTALHPAVVTPRGGVRFFHHPPSKPPELQMPACSAVMNRRLHRKEYEVGASVGCANHEQMSCVTLTKKESNQLLVRSRVTALLPTPTALGFTLGPVLCGFSLRSQDFGEAMTTLPGTCLQLDRSSRWVGHWPEEQAGGYDTGFMLVPWAYCLKGSPRIGLNYVRRGSSIRLFGCWSGWCSGGLMSQQKFCARS